MRQIIYILSLYLLPASAIAAGLPHDQVERFSESSYSTQRRVEPYLVVRNGCQPYAAVNSAGDYNRGLKATGRASSGCNDSTKGNTYVRGVCVRHTDGWNYCARMYAWFFPKDVSRAAGIGGHRYDWEDTIVYTAEHPDGRFNFEGVATSAHGDYTKHTSADRRSDSVVVIYGYHGGLFDGATHSMALGKSSDGGHKYPLISWDRLTNAARNTLNNRDWGRAVCPLKNANFRRKLNEGKVSGIPVTF